MSRQVKIRRGTAAQHETFIGAEGEITMDTTNNTLRVHDGTTPGGHLVGGSALPANADYVVETQQPNAANGYTWYRKYKSGWVEQGSYLGGVGAQATKQITFAVPYRGMHDYFIFALGTNSNVYWTGGNTRTNNFCTIKNGSNETNYIDVYTCGWAA